MSIKALPQEQTVNYFCTWAAQNQLCAKGYEAADPALFEGDQGAKGARHCLTDDILFGEGGLAHQYPAVRSELYLMLDDGWDVPFGIHPDKSKWGFGSLAVDPVRFPALHGTPAERLKQLNDRVKLLGWRGVGIWVAAQKAGDDYDAPFDEARLRDYYTERILWSKHAGVRYWKVDWGTHCHSVPYRKLLTDLGHALYPELWIEHAFCCPPTNGEAGTDKIRFADQADQLEKTLAVYQSSDVFRSYDVTGDRLCAASTLDRLYELLLREGGIVNCEDELYIGAALGCSIGIMRSTFGLPSRISAHRLAEVDAAVRFQKIAPPFAGGELLASDKILTDAHLFAPGDTWDSRIIGKTVVQAAPAVMARNTALPTVKETERAPYVICSRNPAGAYAVAAIRRYQHTSDTIAPDVTCPIGALRTVGVFGEFEVLRLCTDAPITRISATCLHGPTPTDITASTEIVGNTVCVSGALLRSLACAHDDSENAVILQLS